jgi:hypothetical protein
MVEMELMSLLDEPGLELILDVDGMGSYAEMSMLGWFLRRVSIFLWWLVGGGYFKEGIGLAWLGLCCCVHMDHSHSDLLGVKLGLATFRQSLVTCH